MAALAAAAAANRPIPERLKAKWGDKWEKLDPTVREQFHEYETHIGRVTSKYGKDAQAWSRVAQIFAPYQPMLQREGGKVEAILGNMLEFHRIMREGLPAQKQAMLQTIAQTFQIPLPQAAAAAENAAAAGQTAQPAPTADPDLIARLTALERQQLTSAGQSEYYQRQQIEEHLDAFLARPDVPYIKEPGYLATMSQLIAAGIAQDLNDAYQQAAMLNPRTRELEVAKARQREVQAGAEQAARARQAAISPSGTNPGQPRRDASKLTLRETLEAAFNGDLDT